MGDRATREAYSGALPTLVLNDERLDALDALDALEDETLGVESHGEGDFSGEEVEGKAVRRYMCTVFSTQNVFSKQNVFSEQNVFSIQNAEHIPAILPEARTCDEREREGERERERYRPGGTYLNFVYRVYRVNSLSIWRISDF